MNPNVSNSAGNQSPQISATHDNSELPNHASTSDIENLKSQYHTENIEKLNKTASTYHPDAGTNNDVTKTVHRAESSNSEIVATNDNGVNAQVSNISSANGVSRNEQTNQVNAAVLEAVIQQGAAASHAEGRSENSENITGAEAATAEYPDDDDEVKESLLAKKLTIVMEKLEAYRATRDYMIALANKLKEENVRYETEFGLNTEEGEGASVGIVSASSEPKTSENKGNQGASSGPSTSEGIRNASSGGNIQSDYRLANGITDEISNIEEDNSKPDAESLGMSQSSTCTSLDSIKPFQAGNQVVTNQSTETNKSSAAEECCSSNEITNKLSLSLLNSSSSVSSPTIIDKQAGQWVTAINENKADKKSVVDHEADDCDDDDLDYDDDYYDVSEDIDYISEEDDNDDNDEDIERSLVTPSSQINKPGDQRGAAKAEKCRATKDRFCLQNMDQETSTRVHLSHTETQNQCQSKEKDQCQHKQDQCQTKEQDQYKASKSKDVAGIVNKSTETFAAEETGPPSSGQTMNLDYTKVTTRDDNQLLTNATSDLSTETNASGKTMSNTLSTSDNQPSSNSSTKTATIDEIMKHPSASDKNDHHELQMTASIEDSQATSKPECLPSDDHTYLNMNRVERLNLMLRLQTEFAKLQLQLVHIQENMRAATAVLTRLATLEHDDQS